MADDVDSSVQQVFSELCECPPMSEEEFRFRLEPLRRLRDGAIPILLDHLGAEDSLHDLAAATLHELAAPQDLDRLLAAFRDPARPERARAEIAQVLAGVAGTRLATLLAPDELARLSALSLETLLARYRDRAGVAQVVSLYRQSSPADRRALLDAIEAATRGNGAPVRLGGALDPLFSEETDPELRTLMIRRLGTRAEAASARSLARWVAECHGEERRLAKEALRRLARLGIRTPAREGAPAAWISGADGTGCYNVGISFPTALGLRDVLLACIGVEAGLRAVSLLAAVEKESVAEIRSSLEVGQA
ncbi:MAG: hypothetical protein ACREQ9_16090, partial [Candidatus Binatia bacterium]